MKRTSLLVAMMLVVGMLAAPAVGAVAQEESDDEADTAPGERLSGVVGVQAAELDGELEENAFTIALERADDNATEASHIAEKLNETEERLDELEERKAALEEQRGNGEITEGEYRAEMAVLATETDNVNNSLNQSEEAADNLPAETLEENGVDVTAIQTLKENASELSGEEVSEIAQSIAGDESGDVPRENPEDRDDAEDRDETDDGDASADGDEASDRDEADEGNEERPDDAEESDDEQQADDDEEMNDEDADDETDDEDAGQP